MPELAPERPRQAFAPIGFGRAGAAGAERYAAACLRRLALAPAGRRHRGDPGVAAAACSRSPKAGQLDPTTGRAQIKGVGARRGATSPRSTDSRVGLGKRRAGGTEAMSTAAKLSGSGSCRPARPGRAAGRQAQQLAEERERCWPTRRWPWATSGPTAAKRGRRPVLGCWSVREIDFGAIPPADGYETLGDFAAEVARLAALPPHEYERCRREAAKGLGVRAPTLDEAVKSARPRDEDGEGQGEPITPEDPEPWPDPVDGAELLDAARGLPGRPPGAPAARRPQDRAVDRAHLRVRGGVHLAAAGDHQRDEALRQEHPGRHPGRAVQPRLDRGQPDRGVDLPGRGGRQADAVDRRSRHLPEGQRGAPGHPEQRPQGDRQRDPRRRGRTASGCLGSSGPSARARSR